MIVADTTRAHLMVSGCACPDGQDYRIVWNEFGEGVALIHSVLMVKLVNLVTAPTRRAAVVVRVQNFLALVIFGFTL